MSYRIFFETSASWVLCFFYLTNVFLWIKQFPQNIIFTHCFFENLHYSNQILDDNLKPIVWLRWCITYPVFLKKKLSTRAGEAIKIASIKISYVYWILSYPFQQLSNSIRYFFQHRKLCVIIFSFNVFCFFTHVLRSSNYSFLCYFGGILYVLKEVQGFDQKC